MNRFPALILTLLTAACTGGSPEAAAPTAPAAAVGRSAGSGPGREYLAQVGPYRVVADGSEAQARLVAARLYVAWCSYRRLIPPPAGVEPAPNFDVRVFTRRPDYVRYMTERLGDEVLARQSAGGFVPRTGEIVFTSGPTDGRAFAALYHEGFHQYFLSFVSRPPVWLNEGLKGTILSFDQ